MTHLIPVEVAFADAQHQVLLTIEVPSYFTVQAAIQQSGILEQCPQLKLLPHLVGIFGEIVSQERQLQAGDRIEIYVPLHVDPKTARRQRAK